MMYEAKFSEGPRRGEVIRFRKIESLVKRLGGHTFQETQLNLGSERKEIYILRRAPKPEESAFNIVCTMFVPTQAIHEARGSGMLFH
jgi:hypothetical protein